MSTLINDIKYALRQLRKSPGFTIIAVLTLALGLGINTSVFSVINSVLLNQLPLKDADRLMRLLVEREHADFIDSRIVSYPDFADWREQSKSFEDMAAYTSESKDIITQTLPENLWGLTVSQGFFKVIGIDAALGRTFIEGEDQPGAARVIVLGHKMWQQHYTGDQDILGKTVILEDAAYTVVGVLPPDFPGHLFDNPEFFIPLTNRSERNQANYNIVGRIRSDLTFEQAQKELNAVAARLHKENGTDIVNIRMTPLLKYITGNSRLYLLCLLGTTSFVLLIACVNLTNLVLARTAARRKEITVRRALGSGLFRIAQQMLTESLILTLLGGMAGLLLAYWTSDLLRLYLVGIVPRANEIHLDGRVLCFTLLMSLVTGFIVALAPVFRLRGYALQNLLGERSKTAHTQNRISDALVVFEISAAMILLMGAGLMIRTFHNLLSADPGFNSDRLLSFRVKLPDSRYGDANKRQAFCQRAIERLNTLPGVESVAMSNMTPFGRAGNYINIQLLNRVDEQNGDINGIGCHVITQDYLTTLDIPLFSGRAFKLHDFSDKARTVIINQKLAQTGWPDENPIGQLIKVGWTDDSYEIIGIVGNTFQEDQTEEVEMSVYLPYCSATTDGYCGLYSFVVRTHNDPASLITNIRTALLEVDPALPIQRLASMHHHMAKSIRQERFTLISLGLFAGVALILVIIGIYGVVSYVVSQRTNEVGVRIALGAQYSQIMNMILKKGLILAGMGSVIGIAGAIGLTRFLSSYLYGITPTDPVTFVIVPVVITVFAILACIVPARRAAKIDPMEALRYE